MSAEYKNADLNALSAQAERDLNSDGAKKGHGASLSATESGVNSSVENRFAGAEVTYGSAASGTGNNREIPLSEGGDINPRTGQLFKAGDFEQGGVGETKQETLARTQGGDDAVRENVRN
ncbi:hypothetical protein DPSP01_012240 [Paraphaeosphaeria sporulosa]|uniref:Uncharacterized protein n=1 Tax=Paraphaeosphaeria sporulosa TaxID=1460663 RepID=A0A177CYK4_9PLEO|nr:uncharacterized protein CC84DRAFT_1133853 [Paraphaeosphaeria sporulosa]OAG11799.1 hypothetical protein CC84DRAFT_1133853 [Paraphaeosphaeria sporulosa]